VQLALAHSSLPPHAEPPSFFITHALPAQYAAAVQSPSVTHIVPHTAPLQALEPHDVIGPALQTPLPSHRDAVNIAPFAQPAGAHSVDAGEGVQVCGSQQKSLQIPEVLEVEVDDEDEEVDEDEAVPDEEVELEEALDAPPPGPAGLSDAEHPPNTASATTTVPTSRRPSPT
jgi:hypothetical protein